MELWYQGTFASQTTCSAAFQLEDPGINLSRLLVLSLLLESSQLEVVIISISVVKVGTWTAAH